MKQMKIIAFGNPLFDTSTKLQNNDLLKKYNLKNDDQREVSAEQLHLIKNDIKTFHKECTAGGCAQNSLKVLQWLLPKQCSGTIFGSVGTDPEALTLQSLLESIGVETLYVKHAHHPTGATVALVNGVHRALVAHLGAAEVLTVADLGAQPELASRLEAADLVYVEGFFLTKRGPVALKILEMCQEMGKKVAFNLCGRYLCDLVPETLKLFVESADILFGNKLEFEALCELYDGKSVEEMIGFWGGKIVVVTNGPGPVLCVDRGAVKRLMVPLVQESAILDTTGAGDAFVGGFLAGFLQEMETLQCCRLGCYAAGEIIQRMGCQVPEHMPAFSLNS